MTPADRERGRSGRRHLLKSGLGAVVLLFADRVWAAPRPAPPPAPPPAQPAGPPRPGDPPDKQTTTGITVQPGDPAITAGAVEYPGIAGLLLGYLAVPKGSEVYPGVLVLHDATGLGEHYRDIARRLAKAGLVALAPDLASRAGGVEKLGDSSKINAALQAMGAGQYVQDLNASVRYLEAHPFVAKTRIGALGFGTGGNLIWLALAGNGDIKAAVSVSGTIPSGKVVSSISAAVLSIYGADDRRDEEAIVELDGAMKKAGLAFTMKLEPKAGRNFFNDTTAAYVPAAAKDAWAMTLDWFAQHLKG